MGEGKHTAGPWKHTDTYPSEKWVVHSETALGPGKHQARTIAHAYAQADALLIAAAPDLLEALQEMVASVNREAVGAGDGATYIVQPPSVEAQTKARAAIARATGQDTGGE